MRLFLHDDVPSEPHGEDGPTHAGTITVDYEYQIEQWAIEAHDSLKPEIVRLRCPELHREWKRTPVGFVETTESCQQVEGTP